MDANESALAHLYDLACANTLNNSVGQINTSAMKTSRQVNSDDDDENNDNGGKPPQMEDSDDDDDSWHASSDIDGKGIRIERYEKRQYDKMSIARIGNAQPNSS